jgi:DNA ligase-1
MQLAELVSVSGRVASTRSRRAKVEALADAMARLEEGELAIGVPFLAGTIRQGRIGIGPRVLARMRAVAPASVPSLRLTDVDDALAQLASLSGKGAAKAREETLGALFGRATLEEQDFLRRLLLGELRQGALEPLLAEATAKAAQVPLRAVRRAHMVVGSLARVATVAMREGEPGLAGFDLEVFRPVLPMLAQPAEDAADALAALGSRAAFEPKLDGVRVQVHKRGAEVRIFSRRLHDVTVSVPELVEAAQSWLASDAILDGEALALRADGRPHSFQVTMRRFGRETDVDAMRAQLPLRAFFFDCLYLDGASLIDEPAQVRVAALARAVSEGERVDREVLNGPEAARQYVSACLNAGYEGAMAKDLSAPYEAGSRGAAWRKLKHAHTLDLVVLAAEWGSGRRRGTLSNLHLGARDERRTGAFVMLGKTFKGLTDRLLRWQTEALLDREISRDGHVVYVRPELVVEVAFSDVQTSPQYPGGLALRFARVKGYREDKRPEDADTMATVRALHGG